MLLKGKKIWSELDGREMSRKELVIAYMPSFMREGHKILTDYAQRCETWNWKIWGDETTVYWMKNTKS